MAAVVALNGNAVLNHGEAHPDLVARLEQMLADAKSGHLIAIAYAAFHDDRSIHTHWTGCCDEFDMVAGIHRLDHRFMQATGAGD